MDHHGDRRYDPEQAGPGLCAFQKCRRRRTRDKDQSTSTGEGYALRIDAAGLPVWQLNGADMVVSNMGSVNDNQWHHLAGVVKRGASGFTGEAVLYVDGVDAGYASFGGTVANDQGLSIGGIEGVFSKRFAGFIDHVVVSRRGLSQVEVNTFMGIADLTWHPATFTKTSGGTTRRRNCRRLVAADSGEYGELLPTGPARHGQRREALPPG